MIRVAMPDGTVIGIHFIHGDPFMGPLTVGQIVRETTCTLYRIDPSDEPNGRTIETRLAQGVSRCKHPDIFRKSKARTKALTRAIACLNLDKPERTLLWQAYHERNN